MERFFRPILFPATIALFVLSVCFSFVEVVPHLEYGYSMKAVALCAVSFVSVGVWAASAFRRRRYAVFVAWLFPLILSAFFLCANAAAFSRLSFVRDAKPDSAAFPDVCAAARKAFRTVAADRRFSLTCVWVDRDEHCHFTASTPDGDTLFAYGDGTGGW